MRCFNHPDAQAAGLCKHCSRGICAECIALVEDAVSCGGECGAHVERLHRMMEHSYGMMKRSDQLIGGTANAYAGLAVGTGVLGVVMLSFGLLSRYTEIRMFTVPAGLVFIIAAVFLRGLSRRFASKESDTDEKPRSG
jgi:hypothetical protein